MKVLVDIKHLSMYYLDVEQMNAYMKHPICFHWILWWLPEKTVDNSQCHHWFKNHAWGTNETYGMKVLVDIKHLSMYYLDVEQMNAYMKHPICFHWILWWLPEKTVDNSQCHHWFKNHAWGTNEKEKETLKPVVASRIVGSFVRLEVHSHTLNLDGQFEKYFRNLEDNPSSG